MQSPYYFSKKNNTGFVQAIDLPARAGKSMAHAYG
jgi:hypothetical protein